MKNGKLGIIYYNMIYDWLKNSKLSLILCKAVVSILLLILVMCLQVLVSCICMYTARHNCSSLGSLIFTTNAVLLR